MYVWLSVESWHITGTCIWRKWESWRHGRRSSSCCCNSVHDQMVRCVIDANLILFKDQQSSHTPRAGREIPIQINSSEGHRSAIISTTWRTNAESGVQHRGPTEERRIHPRLWSQEERRDSTDKAWRHMPKENWRYDVENNKELDSVSNRIMVRTVGQSEPQDPKRAENGDQDMHKKNDNSRVKSQEWTTLTRRREQNSKGADVYIELVRYENAHRDWCGRNIHNSKWSEDRTVNRTKMELGCSGQCLRRRNTWWRYNRAPPGCETTIVDGQSRKPSVSVDTRER